MAVQDKEKVSPAVVYDNEFFQNYKGGKVRVEVRILDDDEELDPEPNRPQIPTLIKRNPKINGVITEPEEKSNRPVTPKSPKESISTQPGSSPPANSSGSGSGQAGPPPGARGFHGATGENANSVPTWARPVVDLAGYAYVGGYAIVTAPARLARGTINFVDRFSRMDWEQRILTVTQPLFQTALHFSPQGMLKSWLSQAQSYWDYANDPFSGNWAAWNYITSGGTDGLAYQTGDFIGTNLTIGAITGAAGAPFAGGGGGVTTIFPEGVPTTPNPNILSYRSKYQGGPYPRGQFGRGGPLWQQDSTYRSGQVRAERIVHDAGRQMGLNVHQLVDEILYIPESRSPFFTVENGQRILGMNKNAVFGSDPSLRTLKAGHELGHAYVYDNRHIVGSLSYEAEEIAVEGLARNKLGNSLSQRALRNSIRYENTFRKILGWPLLPVP